MKFLKSLFLLLPLALTACDNNARYYSKPEDSNLDFWITQGVSYDDFNKERYAVMPGFGVAKFYDRRYTDIPEDVDTVTPELVTGEYLSYEVSGYPDVMDASAVIAISIAHPDINIYGLTIKSTEEEVKNVMDKKADRLSVIASLAPGANFYLAYKEGNINYSFSNICITMRVPQTNNKNVVFQI